MRKLASIQLINTVEPIEGADAIERVRVLGWWVVAKKEEYKPGDKIVYCEIDSLLPVRPEFEFLRAGSFKPAIIEGETLIRPEGFRIKTVKLRGQVSQGICFPLSILQEGSPTGEGDDVTELLGIIKYEAPIPTNMRGRVKGSFPAFLPKTDETRVQVIPNVLERHRGNAFYLTEKLDGTSFTAFLHNGEFGICGRNQWIDETDESCVLVKVARRLNLEAKLRTVAAQRGFNPAVQGEVIGPGIQKNRYALREVDMRVFNVLDIDQYKLVDHALMLNILQEADLPGVPQLGTMLLNHTVDELVAMAEGVSVLNDKVQREGIVLRPLAEQNEPDIGGRLSFKAINPKFLLKYDE